MVEKRALVEIYTHVFDVAVSFPGEHRKYVETVINALSTKIAREKIFYDEWYKPFLAVLDLDILLQKIYRDRSNLIVAFLCGQYQKKEWCGLEARAIRDLIKTGSRKKIMLVRMDDEKVDGFFGIDGWIDARKNTAEQVAGFIYQRLNGEVVFPISVTISTETSEGVTFPVRNLDERNLDFSGRENELNKIHDYFKKGGSVCVKQAIAGLGGIGKTQLALEYAHKFKDEYTHGICWVNATESLKIDLRVFAEELGLVPKSMPSEEPLKDEDVLKKLTKWFAVHTSFLLIFDNIELDNIEATKIIESFSRVGGGHVLITTRDRKLNLPNTKVVDLDVFTVDDAKLFVRKRLSEKTIGVEQKLDELLERLGRLPLALEQATCYMANTDIDCPEYLSLLSEHGLKVFEPEPAKPRSYSEIVTTTWAINFEKISQPACQLLYLCAYMVPDKIPLDFFVQQKNMLPVPLRDELSDTLAINNVVQSLVKYALVKREGAFLSVHRLVQEAVRYSLTKEMSLQCVSYCLDVAYGAFMYEFGTKQLMDVFVQNVPHALEVAHNAEEMLDKSDENIQKKIAWLYRNAGRGFHYSSQYVKALVWYSKALDICERVLGEKHQYTAIIYNDVGLVYDHQGRFVEALEMYFKALDIENSVESKEHSHIATIYNNIGLTFTKQRRFVEALEMYFKALDIEKSAEYKKNVHIAIIYNSIAGVYYEQGKYDDALLWYNEALVIHEKTFDQEFSIALVRGNIANIYCIQGNFVKALELFKEALVFCEDVLGKAHPHTASTYNNIANVYNGQRKFDAALDLYFKALAICESVLGEEHPTTLDVYHNIADVYDKQERYVEALEWYSNTLAGDVKVLGKEHPYTAYTSTNIARVYDKQGDFVKALEWYKKSLPICGRAFGENHVFTKNVLDRINSLSKYV